MSDAHYIIGDYETASATDLKKAGAWRYSECPTTEIISFTFQDIDGRILLWTPAGCWANDEAHQRLMALAADPNAIFVAHNAGFEKAIWRNVMVSVFRFPDVPNLRWVDTMAMCAMRALPQDLERSLAVLKLPFSKDTEGSKLTISLSKPNKRGEYDRSPATLERVYAYNRSDILGTVGLHVRLGNLPPAERNVWLLDQRINERGVRLDRHLVESATAVIDAAKVPLAAEFADITGGLKMTQRLKVKTWVNDQGVSIPNTSKETLARLLGSVDGDEEAEVEDDPGAYMPTIGENQQHVARALKLLQLGGSTSITKLARMGQCVCADGRARGLLQYHGTAPGLWAGRLFQPQNFPRPVIGIPDGVGPTGVPKYKEKLPTVETVVDAIMSRDYQHVESLGWHHIIDHRPLSAIEVVVSALRHTIVSDPDRLLLVGDFAGIQARLTLALAGQYDKVELMATPGADIYIDMAQTIYKRPLNKKDNPEERQIGKNCFAADTLVLTDQGFIPITDVSTEHQLWDGEEWVKHGGLISQGLRPTQEWQGVSATREHLVLAGERWCRWDSLEHAENSCPALATGLENLLSLAIAMARVAASRKSWSGAHVGPSRILSHLLTWSKVTQPDAAFAHANRQDIGERNFTVTPTLCQTKPTEFDSSTASRPVLADAIIQKIEITDTTEAGASTSLERGARTEKSSFDIWSLLPDGMTRLWNSTASTWTKGISRETFDLRLVRSTLPTSDESKTCNGASPNLKNVYDIANAGPRHRFIILTKAGPLVVHNCVLGLGFQMGARKFYSRYGKGQTFEFIEDVVKTYRQEWAPEVRKLWYGLDEASAKAVWDGKPHEFHGIRYAMHDGWLTCRLPSGRLLWYPNATKVRKVMPWSTDEDPDIRQGWTYNAMKQGQWKTINAFGGLLTENCAMGMQRDLLTRAMFTCERENLPGILNVHDEFVAEPLIKDADPKKLEQIMSDVPDWAKQLRVPVAAETWAGDRYRK